MTYEFHAKIDFPAGAQVELCPVCGDAGELYRCSDGPDLPTETAVMCTNGERFGPQDGLVSEGCLLYLPQDSFYRPTARDAIRYWNDYAIALSAQRRQRHLDALPADRVQVPQNAAQAHTMYRLAQMWLENATPRATFDVGSEARKALHAAINKCREENK